MAYNQLVFFLTECQIKVFFLILRQLRFEEMSALQHMIQFTAMLYTVCGLGDDSDSDLRSRTVQTQTSWTYSWNPYSPVSPRTRTSITTTKSIASQNETIPETLYGSLKSPSTPFLPPVGDREGLTLLTPTIPSTHDQFSDASAESDQLSPCIIQTASPLPPDAKPRAMDIYIRLLPSSFVYMLPSKKRMHIDYV